jgi:hypothetical protein
MCPEEYALWDVSRKLAHQTGVLYFDGREMANRFADTKKDCIYRIARALVEKGWYEVISPPTRNKRTGLYTSAQYRVLSAEEWAGKNPHVCVTTTESSLEIQTGNQSGKRDRHQHQSANPEPPVWKSRTSSLEIQTYSDKENLDKEILRESPVLKSRLDETATASLPPDSFDSIEADYKNIRMQLARNCWQATPQTEHIARNYLKDGHSKESVWQAIEATMRAMPDIERQPGLYLAQNLKGNMDLLVAGEVPRHARRPQGNNRPTMRDALDTTLASHFAAERRADGTYEGELPMLTIPDR